MQYLKTLRKISLILIFVLISFSCAKNKTAVTDFGITAEAVQEGILVTFINLPDDTTHLWIQVTSWSDAEVPENKHNVVSSYAALTVPSVQGWINSTRILDIVKQTNKIIFPFVQTGIKYYITATIYNEDEFLTMRGSNGEAFYPRQANTEIIAANGIYFNRDEVKLELDNYHSVVTLTYEPVFTGNVSFDNHKYSYGVVVLADNNGSIGIGDHHFPEGLSYNGLTWTFEPYFTDDLRSSDVALDWLGIGKNNPAYAQAYVNIIYDDIKWCVEIAKTSEFDYSL